MVLTSDNFIGRDGGCEVAFIDIKIISRFFGFLATLFRAAGSENDF
jgi:hypothetical protein